MKTVDEFANKSMVQELPYTSAQQAYLQACARDQERREEEKHEDTSYLVIGGEEDMRDWRVKHRYEQNFGPLAATSTLCRGDSIEPK